MNEEVKGAGRSQNMGNTIPKSKSKTGSKLKLELQLF